MPRTRHPRLLDQPRPAWGVATERGSTSLVMIALVVVAATFAAVVGAVGAVSAATSRAQGAADASALAAAAEARDVRALSGCLHTGCLNTERWVGIRDASCGLAASVVGEWGAGLEECFVDSKGAVTVTVGVQSVVGSIKRSARAGTG